ncbi:MAG: LamG domain-containing protein [Armatimonadetes bacterium]|nr:LamG domain-containing protein [Armatimonadota bacterium]
MRSSALILTVIGLVACVPVFCQEGLVAHWRMDSAEGNVVADASGAGHHAAFFSKGDVAPVFVPGMYGKAVKLDEKLEQGFNVANSADLNFAGPFTVMAWVKPTRRNATFEIACMKGDKSGEPPWPGWRLRFFWARAAFQVGTPDGLEPQVSSAEWSVPADHWSHVAGQWDGGHLRVFVNAVEKAQTQFAGTIAPQPAWRGLVLGNYVGRKNAYAFDGLMDDVRIYNRALTEDEVFAVASGADQ